MQQYCLQDPTDPQRAKIENTFSSVRSYQANHLQIRNRIDNHEVSTSFNVIMIIKKTLLSPSDTDASLMEKLLAMRFFRQIILLGTYPILVLANTELAPVIYRIALQQDGRHKSKAQTKRERHETERLQKSLHCFILQTYQVLSESIKNEPFHKSSLKEEQSQSLFFKQWKHLSNQGIKFPTDYSYYLHRDAYRIIEQRLKLSRNSQHISMFYRYMFDKSVERHIAGIKDNEYLTAIRGIAATHDQFLSAELFQAASQIISLAHRKTNNQEMLINTVMLVFIQFALTGNTGIIELIRGQFAEVVLEGYLQHTRSKISHPIQHQFMVWHKLFSTNKKSKLQEIHLILSPRHINCERQVVDQFYKFGAMFNNLQHKNTDYKGIRHKNNAQKIKYTELLNRLQQLEEFQKPSLIAEYQQENLQKKVKTSQSTLKQESVSQQILTPSRKNIKLSLSKKVNLTSENIQSKQPSFSNTIKLNQIESPNYRDGNWIFKGLSKKKKNRSQSSNKSLTNRNNIEKQLCLNISFKNSRENSKPETNRSRERQKKSSVCSIFGGTEQIIGIPKIPQSERKKNMIQRLTPIHTSEPSSPNYHTNAFKKQAIKKQIYFLNFDSKYLFSSKTKKNILKHKNLLLKTQYIQLGTVTALQEDKKDTLLLNIYITSFLIIQSKLIQIFCPQWLNFEPLKNSIKDKLQPNIQYVFEYKFKLLPHSQNHNNLPELILKIICQGKQQIHRLYLPIFITQFAPSAPLSLKQCNKLLGVNFHDFQWKGCDPKNIKSLQTVKNLFKHHLLLSTQNKRLLGSQENPVVAVRIQNQDGDDLLILFKDTKTQSICYKIIANHTNNSIAMAYISVIS